MAEFLVKVADEQGHLKQHVEHGYSEAEVHDRFTQQGYLVYWVKPRSLLSSGGMPMRVLNSLRSMRILTMTGSDDMAIAVPIKFTPA